MNKYMWVKARPGLPCPKETCGSGSIGSETAVRVPASQYYRRRVADGSLDVCAEPKTAPATARKVKEVTSDTK